MKTNFDNKIEFQDEKESPYVSTGYIRLPEIHEVRQKKEKQKRAPQPSPLLQEFLAGKLKK